MILIVCHSGSSVGLGHLTRMLALNGALHSMGHYDTTFLIFGEKIRRQDIENLNHYVMDEKDFPNKLEDFVNKHNFKIVVFDLYPGSINENFESVLVSINKLNLFLIGVDSLYRYWNRLNLIWIPSFFKPVFFNATLPPNVIFGWDTYLIRKDLTAKKWTKGNNVLILTGGSDSAGMSQLIPKILDASLPEKYNIHWVKGPFSKSPDLPSKLRLKWDIHENLEHLDSLILSSNYAVTVFGVSFFELMQYGIPTVVFSPYGDKDSVEMNALKNEKVALVSSNYLSAINDLCTLIQDDDKANILSLEAKAKMSANGAQKLASVIHERLKII